MNEQLQSTRRAHARVERINGRAADTELADSRLNVGPTEMFQHRTREGADHLRMWPLSSRGQELGTENSQSNEFMTVFSHELRNSLGAIRMAAQILRMETSAGPPAVKARLLIERQVGQMTRLVEDLLDVSRVRSGQMALHCERIDLRAVAAHAAQTVELTMQQRNHWMTTSVPDAPVWLQADARPTGAGVREPALERSEVHRCRGQCRTIRGTRRGRSHRPHSRLWHRH